MKAVFETNIVIDFVKGHDLFDQLRGRGTP